MTRRLCVLVDVDDVLTGFSDYYVDRVNKLTNRSYSLDQVTQYVIEKALALEPWVVREMDEHLAQPNLAHRLPPIMEAVTAVRVLSRSADVVFVTTPLRISKTWAHDREEWLRARFGDLPVIHTAHKQYVDGDVFVDDKAENIARWAERHPAGLPILWDRPYNRDYQVTEPTRRMSSWPEFTDVVSRLSAGCCSVL